MQETNRKCRFYTWIWKIPWRRKWQLTPVFSPERIPWAKEPDRLQSTRSQRVRHDWATKHKHWFDWTIFSYGSHFLFFSQGLLMFMLKLKLQYFGHLMQRNDSLKETLMLGRIDPKGYNPVNSSHLWCLDLSLLKKFLGRIFRGQWQEDRLKNIFFRN